MIDKDSRKEISDYVFLSKYAQTLENGKKETWFDAVNRVKKMHWDKYSKIVKPEFMDRFTSLFNKSFDLYAAKVVLGAQRGLQFGGELLIKKNARLFNCSATYIDRIEVFQEIMYLLLCGCGVGYSVQNVHISQLPIPKGFNKEIEHEQYYIPDSIEGWAFAVGKLMNNYYNGGAVIDFDYSAIRKRGAFIRGGFKAPGPEPLKEAINKITGILSSVSGRKLSSFELHYIICIIANSVISGGIRRSAMISIFDVDDKEMLKCKTGSWMQDKLELCRANNSVAILPDTPKEKYAEIFKNVKEYGEPGFVFVDNRDFIYNPCGEVCLFPKIKDLEGNYHSGWGFCNLTEINGGAIDSKEDFYEACIAASVIGTLQAGYTDFALLTKWSKEIAKRDSLIGVGITGMCEKPEIFFNEEIQREGAQLVRETNEEVAKMIGINAAARCTVIKPSGNSSQLLGTLSGITPGHSKHYIRHIQAANTEQAIQLLEEKNPDCVENSFYSPKKEKVIAFPITLDNSSLLKKNLSAKKFLELVLITKKNWIDNGTNFDHPATKENPTLRMNVSNTCTVKPNEWDEVMEYIWENRNSFGGISLFPSYGDLNYPQAPFTEVLDERELVERYGTGAILSSGLIVDGCKVFRDIYEACEAAIGNLPNLLKLTDEDISKFIVENIKDGKFVAEIDGICFSDVNCVIDHLKNKQRKRLDWVRRFNKFAEKYLNNDKLKTSDCLKHVNIFHKWHALCSAVPVNYNEVKWEKVIKEAGSEIATACAGGQCELK